MDPFLTTILTGLGSGAAQGGAALLGKKRKKKEERRMLAEEKRQSLAALLASLMDQQTEQQTLDVNRSLRNQSRGSTDMMTAAANARRALGV